MNSGSRLAAKYASQFAQVELVTIEHFGGWKLAQKEHFANGGVFDQIAGAANGDGKR